MVKENHKLLKFNSTHKVIIYVDDVNLRGQRIQTISFNSRCRCWECWKYISVPWTACSTKSQCINTCNKSFESVAKFKYLWITLTYQNFTQNEINSSRMHLWNASYHLVWHNLLNSLLPKNVKIKIHTTITLHAVLYGCKTCSFIRRDISWGCLRLGCWKWYLGLREKGNTGIKNTKLWAG